MSEVTPLGVQDTKEVLKFAITLGEAIDAGMADGKLSVEDAALLITPLMSLSAALDGIANVKAEIMDLVEPEMEELVQYVRDELQVTNPHTEKVIEDGIALALRLYAFVGLFKKEEAPATEEPAPEAPADPAPTA